MEILGNNGNNCIKNITWKIIRAKLLRSHRYIFHRYATGPLRTQPECSSSSSLKTHIMFMLGIGFLSQFGCSLCALERLANIKASKTHYSSSKGSGPEMECPCLLIRPHLPPPFSLSRCPNFVPTLKRLSKGSTEVVGCILIRQPHVYAHKRCVASNCGTVWSP